MKTTASIILSVLVVCAASIHSYSQAKATPNVSSLLYKVSGNGLTRPSYVFGTFHAICPNEMVMLDKLDTYLTQTDQLVMEIDMDDAVEMGSMAKAVMIPDGKTLKDFLTVEQFAKVDVMITDLLGYSVENVKMIKPSMLVVLAFTSPKAMGCIPNSYDMALMQSAVAKKKPVVGLETVASQIKVIDSKPLDQQAKGLYEMALKPEASIIAFRKLKEVYSLGDAEKLFEMANIIMTNEKEFQSRLLDERNIAWIPKLETAFKERPSFVAVGAGHLGGPKGVVKLLRGKGYKVEPVSLGPAVVGGN